MNRHGWLKIMVGLLQREGVSKDTAWRAARARLDDQTAAKLNAIVSVDTSRLLEIVPGYRVLGPQPIKKYPDEPHPDNEWEWKSWWVKKMYKPDQPLLKQDIVFIHNCWTETKARWCL